MSLRILFADDSVTAQNMGKKILTDAGYEVVAVSNGAAAVKKIAEQKPDIIILDVYMPGYSGLEVCEKVRSSMATIKTPVLLTVGKMEPYKPEEANRVRADGVIIKPFEASDLLAIIKKFEERIGGQAAAPAEPLPAVVPEPVDEVVDEVVMQPAEKNHEPPPRTVMQPIVEVPDHMATASAFSDLLGTDATGMEQFHAPPPIQEPAPSTQVEQAFAAVEMPEPAVSPVWDDHPEAQAPAAEPAIAVAAPGRPAQIPVYQESQAEHYEMIPTAAAAIGDIEIAREPMLQESAEQTTRETVADLREPDLVSTAHYIEMERQPVRPAAAPVEPVITPVEEFPQAVEAVQQEPDPVVSDVADATVEAVGEAPAEEADFEARVAAAMAAYGHAEETAEAEATAVMPEAPAESVPEAVQEAPAETIETAPAETNLNAAAAAAGVNHEAVATRVEAELAGVAETAAQAVASSEGDHDNIAQAVHRVMERMKENLVEEIVRELKNRK